MDILLGLGWLSSTTGRFPIADHAYRVFGNPGRLETLEKMPALGRTTAKTQDLNPSRMGMNCTSQTTRADVRILCSGGGGGNRTRVRRSLNVSRYVRSLSFFSRVLRLRQTGYGGRQPAKSRFLPTGEERKPACFCRRPSPPQQAKAGRTWLQSMQPGPTVCWHLNFPTCLTSQWGPRHAACVSASPSKPSAPTCASRRKGFAPWRSRTSDLLIKSQLLYQLS